MGNPHRGEVDIAGYKLRFTINSICALEDATGKGIVDIVAEMGGRGQKLATVRSLLWAGLVDRHPEITLQQAGDIIGDVGLPKVTELLTAALAASFPTVEAPANYPPR